MKQQVFLETARGFFGNKLNACLSEGWTVVDGTLQVHLTGTCSCLLERVKPRATAPINYDADGDCGCLPDGECQ